MLEPLPDLGFKIEVGLESESTDEPQLYSHCCYLCQWTKLIQVSWTYLDTIWIGSEFQNSFANPSF